MDLFPLVQFLAEAMSAEQQASNNDYKSDLKQASTIHFLPYASRTRFCFWHLKEIIVASSPILGEKDGLHVFSNQRVSSLFVRPPYNGTDCCSKDFFPISCSHSNNTEVGEEEEDEETYGIGLSATTIFSERGVRPQVFSGGRNE